VRVGLVNVPLRSAVGGHGVGHQMTPGPADGRRRAARHDLGYEHPKVLAWLHWTPEWAELLDPAWPAACFVYEEGRSSQWNRFEAVTQLKR
jgi:hypothetical protein